MTARDLPNIITALRIILVLPMAWALLSSAYGTALTLFIIAGISDGLDGFLAKRFGWVTRLGSILDPVADKFLLVTSYLILGWVGHLPLWLVAVVIGRDLVIVVGAMAYHFLFGRYEMAPSRMSKFNTLMQLVLVAVVFYVLAGGPLDHRGLRALIDIVLVTTLFSGMDYVWVWGRRAMQERRGEKG